MMKVLVDANVWLSYLVNPSGNGTIPTIIRSCLAPEIELLVPQELLSEIGETLSRKPYFQQRVSADDAARFIDLLREEAEVPPLLAEIARYVDDSDDDYLIAYSLMYDADYLVTGDAAVRLLGQIENLQIVTPAAFLLELRSRKLV